MSETIIIADDHPVFRMGLRGLLAGAIPAALLVEAHSVSDMMDRVDQLGAPQMIVLDYLFPGLDPQSTIGELRQLMPRTSIAVVSMLDDRKIIEAILQSGADAFISKAIPADEMLEAILAVRAGELVVKHARPDGSTAGVRLVPQTPDLTERQQQIISLLVEGRSNKEIARALDLSHFTVRNHLSRLMQMMGVNSRAALRDLGRAAPVHGASGEVFEVERADNGA